MLKIEITGETYSELIHNLVEVFAGLDLRQKVDLPDPFQNAIPFPEESSLEKTAPPIEEEPKQAPVIEEPKVAQTELIAEPEAQEPAEVYSFDDIKSLIARAVSNKKSGPAKAILAKYNAKKPSEFKEADYPAIAKDLKELV